MATGKTNWMPNAPSVPPIKSISSQQWKKGRMKLSELQVERAILEIWLNIFQWDTKIKLVGSKCFTSFSRICVEHKLLS
jgi:hypothetical protein